MLYRTTITSTLRVDVIFDSCSPQFLHVMSALAEMERELIVERTRAGLAAARERGRIGGRRKTMTRTIINRAEEMLVAGATRQQVADVIGVGVKTIYKYFPAAVRDQGFLPFP